MHQRGKIARRVFIVGAARSGTTLVQNYLASHPEIHSFPETHFFRATVPKMSSMRLLKRYGRKEREALRERFERIGNGSSDQQLPPSTWSSRQWTTGILRLLDGLSLRASSTQWVEKTPMHLYYIDLIQSVQSDCHFIHVIRAGHDVVASLYDASHRNPEYFAGARSVGQCIRRWKRDVRISERFVGLENHSHVRYEALTKDPERELKRLCAEIGISFRKEMLSYDSEAVRLRLPEEVWKKEDLEQAGRSRKFQSLFSKTTQKRILKQTGQVDLSRFPS